MCYCGTRRGGTHRGGRPTPAPIRRNHPDPLTPPPIRWRFPFWKGGGGSAALQKQGAAPSPAAEGGGPLPTTQLILFIICEGGQRCKPLTPNPWP